MRIPESQVSEVINKTDALSVISEYVNLSKKSGRYWGLCPFHSEKTPSFTVTPEKGLYYCFGCGQGGTVINFLMEIEALSFVEAVKTLAGKAGIQLKVEEDGQQQEKNLYWEFFDKVSKTFHFLLAESSQGRGAREYLLARGIEPQMLKDFSLGYAPESRYWLFDFLKKKNYSDDFLANSGLFSRNYAKIALFRNRIIFPIMDFQNRVVGFGGRALGEDSVKYLNSPETSFFKKKEHLYGINRALPQIRKEEMFVLAEGYIDVIALHQTGIKNAVAPLGTAFTADQARLIKRYAGRACLLFDGDEAGKNATRKTIFLLEKNGLKSVVVTLAKGRDPADIVQKDGSEALHKLLKYPINSFDYLLTTFFNKDDIKAEEAVGILKSWIFPYMKLLDTEVEREACLTELSYRLRIDLEALRKDYRRQGSNISALVPNGQNVPNGPKTPPSQSFGSDLFLLTAVMGRLDSFAAVRNQIKATDLEDEQAKELYIVLEEAYRKDRLTVEFVWDSVGNERLKQLIAGKLSSDEFSYNLEQLIQDTIRKIKQRNIEKRREYITQNLRNMRDSLDTRHELDDLLLEKMYLDGELKKMKGTRE